MGEPAMNREGRQWAAILAQAIQLSEDGQDRN